MRFQITTGPRGLTVRGSGIAPLRSASASRCMKWETRNMSVRRRAAPSRTAPPRGAAQERSDKRGGQVRRRAAPSRTGPRRGAAQKRSDRRGDQDVLPSVDVAQAQPGLLQDGRRVQDVVAAACLAEQRGDAIGLLLNLV